MRVLINGIPALQARTGIGRYTMQLALQLGRRPEVEALGVFTGTRILSLGALPDASRGKFTGAPSSFLRARLRRLPGLRAVVDGARKTFFAWATRKREWSLYHETNYVPRRFPGRVVTTIYDMGFLRRPETIPASQRQWLRDGIPRALARSDQIITVSRFSKSEILEFYPRIDPSRIWVVPAGVAAGYAGPLPKEEAGRRVREDLLLPLGAILFVGSQIRRKNLGRLMAAFQRLPKDLQRAHPLVIAGPDGDMASPERSLLEFLKGRGLAYEAGYVPDSHMPSLMRTAALLCYPSLYEGFGLPPIEAAACGTPVVCSNVSSLPEVMADAAVYVDPDSPEAIADGLRRVIEDPALHESLCRSGRARAAAFTWELCADLTLAVYRAALA